MTSSAETFTYWSLLGLTPGCNAAEVKQAFKREAKRWHPDLNKASSAEERFKWINEAYLVLSDPKRKLEWEISGRPSFVIKGTNPTKEASFDPVGVKSTARQASSSFNEAEKILIVLICTFILFLIDTCFL